MPASVPSAQLPASSIPCLACGYDLRGSVEFSDDHCPECGSAYSSSPGAVRFWSLSPAARRRLRLGATLVAWGAVLAVPLLYVGILVALLGGCLLTSPLHAITHDAPLENLRRRAHALLAAGLLGLAAFATLLAHGYLADELTLYPTGPLADALALTPHALAAAGAVLGLRYLALLLRHVAPRPDHALQAALARLRRDLLLAAAAITLIAAVAAYGGFTLYMPTPRDAILPVFVILATALLAAWLWIETIRTTRVLAQRFAVLA